MRNLQQDEACKIFYKSLKMQTDILDVLAERVQILDYAADVPQKGSNVYESINYQDAKRKFEPSYVNNQIVPSFDRNVSNESLSG